MIAVWHIWDSVGCLIQSILSQSYGMGIYQLSLQYSSCTNPHFTHSLRIAHKYFHVMGICNFIDSDESMCFSIPLPYNETYSSDALGIAQIFGSRGICEQPLALECLYFPILFPYYRNTFSPSFGDNTTDVKTNKQCSYPIPFPPKRLCETFH